jgi:hypothetical protein
MTLARSQAAALTPSYSLVHTLESVATPLTAWPRALGGYYIVIYYATL